MAGCACACTEDLLDRTAYRAAMYELLASVFLVEPDEAFLAALIERGAGCAEAQESASPCGCGELGLDAKAAELDAPGEGPELERLELRVLAHVAAYAGRDLAQLTTGVRSEYAELFLGPRPPLAPPYESIYVGYPRRLFSDVTRAVREIYETNGFEVAARNRVPDDHMGYEAEYMGRLCRLEEAALGAGDPEEAARLAGLQLRFVRAHLNEWAPLFAARVCEAACADYYAAWAQFLRDFVAADLAYLEEAGAA